MTMSQRLWAERSATLEPMRFGHCRQAAELRTGTKASEADHRTARVGTVAGMRVHLVDGTYELFRQHFGSAGRQRDGAPDPGPYAATIGVLGSTLALIEDGATHIGVASDHVIESFRNDLWPGYKTSEGMPPELLAPDPGTRGRAGRDGGRHVGDGRVRGRRRARRGGRHRRRRCTGRTGAHRHSRQGPVSVRQRHPGRAVRPPQAGDHRRGRGDREVRRRTGVDPRLPRTRRRHGRRLPGPARMGRQERGRGARPVRPHRGHPAVGRRLGCARSRGAARSWPSRCATRSSWRCCSGGSPPSSSTSRWARSTTGGGPDRPLGSAPSPTGSARPNWPGEPSERASGLPATGLIDTRSDPAAGRSPPTEVTTRRSAAHERCR